MLWSTLLNRLWLDYWNVHAQMRPRGVWNWPSLHYHANIFTQGGTCTLQGTVPTKCKGAWKSAHAPATPTVPGNLYSFLRVPETCLPYLLKFLYSPPLKMFVEHKLSLFHSLTNEYSFCSAIQNPGSYASFASPGKGPIEGSLTWQGSVTPSVSRTFKLHLSYLHVKLLLF